MHFTDVCFSEEEHTDTGLADAAADSIWKFFVKDCFLERKFASVISSCDGKLSVKRILVNANTHGRKLQSNVENRIINKDIAV